MKNRILLVATLLVAGVAHALACTNLIVRVVSLPGCQAR